MKIYELSADVEQFEWLTPKEDYDYAFMEQFNGEKLKDNWEKIEIVRIKEHKKKLPIGNLSRFLGGAPIFDETAKKILEPVVLSNCEFLEVENSEKKLWIGNVITVIDCLENDFTKNGYIAPSEYVFKTEKIGNNIMFKPFQNTLTKKVPLHGIMVTEKFKQIVEKNNLTGFKFELIWDDSNEEGALEGNGKENSVSSERETCYPYIRELEEDVKKEINDTLQEAMEVFQLKNITDGKMLASKINDIVDDILITHEYPKHYDDLDDVAVALGCLYGHALELGYGWTWKAVGKNKEDAMYSVVSPNENWFNPSLKFMYTILHGKNYSLVGNDNTCLLLYNMLEKKSKTTPAKKLTMLC